MGSLYWVADSSCDIVAARSMCDDEAVVDSRTDAHDHAHPHVPSAAHADDAGDTASAHELLHRSTAETASATAVAALRDAGERVTDARRSVVEVLAHRGDHLSADQVAAILEADSRPVHRATVFRTLERLAEIGVVTRMHVAGGATGYHLAAVDSQNAHLHARCRGCGVVFVLSSAAFADTVARVAANTEFLLEPLQSTLVGVCAECAGSTSPAVIPGGAVRSAAASGRVRRVPAPTSSAAATDPRR